MRVPNDLPEVLLLIETSTSFGRDVLRGIFLYMQNNGFWRIRLDQQGINEPLPTWLEKWRGDGIISRRPFRKIKHFSDKYGIPVVDMNEQYIDFGMPLVFNDEEEIGRLAARHLINCGFKSLAYIGQPGGYWSDGRSRGVHDIAAAAGVPFTEFFGKNRNTSGYMKRIWETETDLVARWVSSLPKPIGIVTCNAFRGLQLMDACRLKEIMVPEQVAIVAGDNEELPCRMAIPNLTAVQNDALQCGYQAAAMLDSLMRGRTLKQDRVFIPPNNLIERGTTDIQAITNPVLALSLAFIRKEACSGINAQDVVRQSGVSRGTLQNLFRNELDKTILEQIIQVRLKNAQELLETTELSLAEIASRCGFGTEYYMSDVFWKVVGMRPGKYRKVYADPRKNRILH